jgi:light-regulated signal transduction histidine kinase (bacteriophytochrome)
VIEHLADIAAGRCTITDQQVDEAAQTDPLLAEMLTGLLFLHEDLALRAAQRDRALAEAETANRELEAFSYSVAHDLRAPLRAIDGFSRILVDKHASALSGEAARYLGLVRSNIERMGMLIDDLLAFARLSRQPLRRRELSPGELAREVVAELQAGVTGRHLEISVADLPACSADPALLRQVFVNLLSNAVKFTRSRDGANIEVGCRTDADPAGQPVYFVRDNGAGFDMRYADKLFGVFQRLHREDEYEGTGVGLATVERIVHRHGGRIWAEAEPDKGATFSFTLGSGPDG